MAVAVFYQFQHVVPKVMVQAHHRLAKRWMLVVVVPSAVDSLGRKGPNRAVRQRVGEQIQIPAEVVSAGAEIVALVFNETDGVPGGDDQQNVEYHEAEPGQNGVSSLGSGRGHGNFSADEGVKVKVAFGVHLGANTETDGSLLPA